jgi:hypothetical protein
MPAGIVRKKVLRRTFMKLNFRIIGKIGFLLVIFGFFMPIACQMNGFQLAEIMIGQNTLGGLLLYVLFISALAGVVIGALLLMKKNMPNFTDWIILLICIGSGLGVFLININGLSLQSGAYVILIGWIVALVAQIISKTKKET